MAYEAKTWTGGEPVTAAYLNRMEQGIAAVHNAVAPENSAKLMLVEISEVTDEESGNEVLSSYTMDVSAEELFNALTTSVVVFRMTTDESTMIGTLKGAYYYDRYQFEVVFNTGMDFNFVAYSADDYPIAEGLGNSL